MGKQAYGTGRSLVAVQEMSATITDIAKNTESAASSANEANASAEKGLAVVNNTTGSMREIASSLDTALTGVSELSEDSKKISEITQIINEIADQTNLLALNAAIEAARAGEQGRGFAVVADEVRKLAERTGSATQDISEMIRRIQARIEHNVKEMNECGRKSEDGVRNAAEAGEALQQINEAIGKVNDMTNRIVAAIEEQSAASNEVAEGISNINIISEETNRSAAELAKHAQELLHLAESLRKQVSIFKV
jgi:methyl-accepting chemotaxis protein